MHEENFFFLVCITIIIEIQNELNLKQIAMEKGLCFAPILKQVLYL